MFSWIKNNYLFFCGYFFIFLCVLFFIFNNSSSNISIFNIIRINERIDNLNYNLSVLDKYENELYSKINLLNSANLDPDYISEIAQKKLGLIKPNRVIVKIDR